MVATLQVSGQLLHHMEAAKDIQEYARAAKGFQCKRLLRKLNDIREETPWVAPVALVGQPFIDTVRYPVLERVTEVGLSQSFFFIYHPG